MALNSYTLLDNDSQYLENFSVVLITKQVNMTVLMIEGMELFCHGNKTMVKNPPKKDNFYSI